MLFKPWLQFLLLGVVLFFAGEWAFPKPKPILGPPNPERLSAMIRNYEDLSRAEITPELLARFVDAELRDELLFREALKRDLQARDIAVEQRIIRNMRFLDTSSDASDSELLQQGYALRLHLTDEVIRRRLVQIMERLIIAVNRPTEPNDEKIKKRYQRDLVSWREPARYSFSHVFLSDQRSAEMPTLIERINKDGLDPLSARSLGAPFLSGYDFRDQSPEQMTRVFGAVFAEQLVEMETTEKVWVGPVQSVFGMHYLYIHKFVEDRTLELDEVRQHIERELRREDERQVVENWIRDAISLYEVRRT